MALNNISKFNWEKVLSKVDNPNVKRSLNLIRARANEVSAAAGKYGAAPEKIDFGAYKNKLRFTSKAVESLEAAYAKKTLPTYTAALPAFEAKKRELTLGVVDKIVDSAKADLAELQVQLETSQHNSISEGTSFGDLAARFPHFAREVEQEIKNHEWSK